MSEKEREKKEKLKLQKQFGIHLAHIRNSKKLTSAELGRLCYMERSSIARLEMGRINPSSFILKKLSVAMEITIEELFSGFK